MRKSELMKILSPVMHEVNWHIQSLMDITKVLLEDTGYDFYVVLQKRKRLRKVREEEVLLE